MWGTCQRFGAGPNANRRIGDWPTCHCDPGNCGSPNGQRQCTGCEGNSGRGTAAVPKPSGARIYFPVYDGQYRVDSANPDGSDRRLVTELASSPAVNGNGSRTLFYSWVADQRGIHRIDTNGGGDSHISCALRIPCPRGRPMAPSMFTRPARDRAATLTTRIYDSGCDTGSKPRQDPPPLVEQAQYPSWGPHDTIVFRDCGFPTDSCGLAVVNADGSNKQTLTNINSTAPAWSPDGSRIVFMSNVAGNWDLYTVSASGGSPQRLTDNPADDGLPVFSPDGTKVAFASKRDGAWGIWQVGSDGKNEVKLF